MKRLIDLTPEECAEGTVLEGVDVRTGERFTITFGKSIPAEPSPYLIPVRLS